VPRKSRGPKRCRTGY